MKRRFQSGTGEWTAERRPGGWGGVVPEGELPLPSQPPVIVFHGPNGELRSLVLTMGAEPTHLNGVSDQILVELLAQAV